MRRVHNTIAETIDLTLRYEQKKFLKPSGLWYGINGDWYRWCKSDMPHWIRPVNFSVDVGKANILVLETDDDMLRFTENELSGGMIVTRSTFIDWPSLALRYDGIEIPKYLWKWRLDPRTTWYYAWDCASGCVWNLDKIKVKKLEIA